MPLASVSSCGMAEQLCDDDDDEEEDVIFFFAFLYPYLIPRTRLPSKQRFPVILSGGGRVLEEPRWDWMCKHKTNELEGAKEHFPPSLHLLTV